MPDHADPFRNFLESSWRCYSLLSGFISSLISRNCGILVGSPSGSISQLSGRRKNHHSAVMAAVKPIEISSSDSDSDWDLDEYRELNDSILSEPTASTNHGALPAFADTSVYGGPSQKSHSQASASNGSLSNLDHQTRANNFRSLPSWAASGTSLTNYGGLSQKAPSRATVSNGSSSNRSHQTQAKLYTLPSSTNDFGVSNSRYTNDNSKYSTRKDYEQNSSGQGSKRILPTSFQPPAPSLRSTNLVENLGNSQMRETYSAQLKPTFGMNHVKSKSGMGSDDEVLMYENSGNRVLPPSFTHAKFASTAPYVSSADSGFRSAAGEERVSEYDERLIYQAALQDLNQPKVEATLPDGLLSVSLLRHQKIALAWMLQKETQSCCCSGGILADDQGLGKTISMIALIQMQKLIQSKSKSEDLSHHTAEALNLDDDEDNDTTALEKGKQDEESHDLKLIPEASTSTRTREFQTRRPQAGTLVVCPASVLRQWARELDEKVADEAKLAVLIYHGSNRTKDPVELATYDVVLTTYAIVANEVPKANLGDEDDDDQKNGDKYGLSSEFSTNKKRKKMSNAGKRRKKGRKGIDSSFIDSDCGTIARVRWLRVILDEAQTIKNHRTQVAKACCGFKAKARWCLSGTPIQNAIDELFSYFRFLRYDPYTTYKSFCSTLKNPISRNSIQGYKKLYAVLRAVMLRRTKGTFIDGEPIIKLPPKTISLTHVDFSVEERAFYRKLEADSRSQFKAYAAAGTLNQNYANILLMLLRLRQACDHPLLVKGFTSDSVGRDSMHMAKNLPRNMLINLMKHLETSAICLSCNDPPEDAIVTMCGHVYCYQCVSEYLRGDENTCPSPDCRGQLGPDAVFSKATLRRCLYDDDLDDNPSSETNKSIVLQNEYSSSKIKAVLEILQSHCKSNSPGSQVHGLVRLNGVSSSTGKELSEPGGSIVNTTHATEFSDLHTEGSKKAIVFSQWTGMLDLVEMSLNQTTLQYRRLDGTMTLSARDKAVKEFNTDPEVTVMLMSLKAGNLGLNMVAASHVILMDLWWNPTTEDQAIDRAHRIGQTRPVTVSRLTIKDTVEDRILALQEEKRKMVASAFGEDQSQGSGTRLTVEDLKYLFMGGP